MLKKPFSFWQNVVFTDETKVRITSDGIVRIFQRNGTSFLGKNTRLLFWGSIRSDGRKMLTKCPNKLNAAGYLEILKYFSTR